MLHFHIDPHSGVPVYRQMIDQLKYYMASGALKAGEQLPSIRELAQSLAINPTELEREGVVEMQHGKGAFVADAARRMTAGERERALRRLARQLAVEAVQTGAPESVVLKIVREELAELEGTDAEEAPVRLTVASKR